MYNHPAGMVRTSSVLEENEYSFHKSIFESIQEIQNKLGSVDVVAKIPEVAASIEQTIGFINTFVKQKTKPYIKLWPAFAGHNFIGTVAKTVN